VPRYPHGRRYRVCRTRARRPAIDFYATRGALSAQLQNGAFARAIAGACWGSL